MPLEEIAVLAPGRNWVDFVFILLFLIIMFIFVYYFRVKPEEDVEKIPPKKEEMPTDDLDKILAFIKKEGGRVTQKDLRRAFPHSEGKMSLMITELEDKGKLKKIKRGRGNILVLT